MFKLSTLLFVTLFLLGCTAQSQYLKPTDTRTVNLYVMTGETGNSAPEIMIVSPEHGDADQKLELYGSYNTDSSSRGQTFIFNWPKNLHKKDTYIPSILILIDQEKSQMYLSVSSVEIKEGPQHNQVRTSQGTFNFSPSTKYVAVYNIDEEKFLLK